MNPTPTNKTKTASTAQLLAELEAGKAKFPAAAAERKEYLLQKQAELARDKNDPSINSPAAISRIVGELNAAQESVEMLDDLQISYLQRRFTENFFRENGDTLADAQLVDLDAATASEPRLIESLKKWLGEFPAKIYQPTISDSDKNALLDERESRENAAEILRCNIRDCRAAIEYFRRNSTPENFGPTRSLLVIIRTAVAV